MAQFGSGSSLLGGTDALQQAMMSRGVDTSILNQQSPASMGGAQPIPQPQTSASPVAPNAPSNNPSVVSGTSAPSSEAELILKALTGRLSVLSKNGF
jgi:hypothetical protein